jgi:penicillin amidase
MLRTSALIVITGSALLQTIPAAASSTAVRQESRSVAGLQSPVEVLMDFWGVPHIYASSRRDMFFTQGYIVARDRLWQIDFLRKHRMGMLAKDFGASMVERDRAARLFAYQGDMEREWASYGPEARSDAEAFVAGINAYVGEVRAGKRPLPQEFKLVGTQPDLWQPVDIVRVRSHALTRNVGSELKRAQVACAAGLASDKLRAPLSPSSSTKVPVGLDPCSIPGDALRDYGTALNEVTLGLDGKVAALDSDFNFFAETGDFNRNGSNNWAIGPSKTATGRPILANDPHRQYTVPALRYISHINAPGYSAIGANEPFIPGIATGHNDKIAFGYTIFAIDQEDLYVYETNPASPNQYRYKGGWEDMRVVTETVEVKGEAPRQVQLKFTRHGPVTYADPNNHRAYAVRSVWSEPGTSAYLASRIYNTGANWKDFGEALSRWATPTLNFVYADTDGNIGWQVAGLAPVRPNWDGLMPVPGDGRYEWGGFQPLDKLPSQLNPATGFVATANEMNMPSDYPSAERKLGFEWADGSRANRIKSVLASKAKLTLQDSMALQMDDHNEMAERLAALLAGVSPTDSSLKAAVTLLQEWDKNDSRDSAAAALYQVWTSRHLGRTVVEAAAPKASTIIGSANLGGIVHYLETARDSAQRERLLLTSLGDAVKDVERLLGSDMSQWAWGRIHRADFQHPFAAMGNPASRAQFSIGSLALGGSGQSPHAASYDSRTFNVTSGASWRMVLDVGEWDNSRAINTPGQSGDPHSPHYRDLFPLWAEGQYIPLLFSRPAVESATDLRMSLSPES